MASGNISGLINTPYFKIETALGLLQVEKHYKGFWVLSLNGIEEDYRLLFSFTDYGLSYAIEEFCNSRDINFDNNNLYMRCCERVTGISYR